MKIRSFTKTGPKGQVVIPKKVREALDLKDDTHLFITVRDGGIYMEPVSEFMHQEGSDDSAYLSILEKTRGAWSEDAVQIEKEIKARRKREIQAAKKLKEQW